MVGGGGGGGGERGGCFLLPVMPKKGFPVGRKTRDSGENFLGSNWWTSNSQSHTL